MIRTATIALALVLLAGNQSEAQSVASLQHGVRIKVTPRSGEVQAGTLTRITADSVSYVPATSPDLPVALALSGVRRLEVSTGRKRARAGLIYGAIGAVVGATAGVLYGREVLDERSPLAGPVNALYSHIFGYLGGTAGLVAGAAYGIAGAKETWRTVPLDTGRWSATRHARGDNSA